MRGKEVPDRWYKYSKYGRIVMDRFVALKVPLSRRIKSVPPHERFTPDFVIEKLPIGLIIDLTNTSRYYDPNDFTSNGVDHVKINVPGRVIPPWPIVERFIEIVNGYLNNPNAGDRVIGVHCTHGLNRTGYLMCAYMILEMGLSPRDAIHLFNTRRGHQMERQPYLDSLLNMRPMLPKKQRFQRYRNPPSARPYRRSEAYEHRQRTHTRFDD